MARTSFSAYILPLGRHCDVIKSRMVVSYKRACFLQDGAPARRRKRPLWKIDENFDPRKSYVIKHPNGTITYVPPKDVDLSGTVSTTGTTATPSQGNPNELVDKMSEASTSDSDKLRSRRALNKIKTLLLRARLGLFSEICLL